MSKMYTRFVQPGRLTLITYGPCEGKMATIVDIVDQRHVVVDGPESVTGVKRHMMPIKRLSLTDFKVNVRRGIREKALKKSLEASGIMKKWSESSWAKKLQAKKARAELTDFERFKLMVAKKKRSALVKKSLKKK